MQEQFSTSEERHISQAEKQQAAEQIFSTIVFEKILGDFDEALENCGYKEEDIEEIENGKKYGFSIGYHVSPFATEGDTIIGKEPDHRDNDLPRAYYSSDYKHLYLKKHGNHLYAVRAEMGPDTSHRQDNDGAWGRAST